MKSKCDNCNWTGEPAIDSIAAIPDLYSRLDPGGIVPSGECPECGCLCYPFPAPPRSHRGNEVDAANPPPPHVGGYTVLLLYPDYCSGNYGEDTFATFVKADSTTEAVAKARKECADGSHDISEPTDLFVIAVFAGEHPDIKPNEK